MLTTSVIVHASSKPSPTLSYEMPLQARPTPSHSGASPQYTSIRAASPETMNTYTVNTIEAQPTDRELQNHFFG